MHIALAAPSTLRLSFAYDAATVAQVKALPGREYDEDTKTWMVPLYLLRRIVNLFPYATVERAAVDARIDMWKRWMIQHNQVGIRFVLVGEHVVPEGEGVSPDFENHVRDLSNVLVQFLGDQVASTSPEPVTKLAESCQPSAGDELVWAGIENARKAEERKAAVVGRTKGRRAGVQGSFSYT